MSVSAGPGADAVVRSLIEAAERAAAAGQADEVARLLGQAQLSGPDHPLVLNALGMRALRNGNPGGARDLLQRAVQADARSPGLWLNLALSCRSLKDPAAEMAALEQALATDPYFFLAHLQKAMLLERQGKPKEAALAFQAFLQCAPTSGNIPAPLQAAMAHARAAVQANSAALESWLRDRLRDSRTRLESERLDRFDACLDIVLGKKRVYTQQPTFMNFPHLPAIQFYERADFGWLAAVEAATDDIRAELLGVLAGQADGFVPYVANPEGTPLNQWKELNHSRRWSAYYLWREGSEVAEHVARCPKTAAVMAQAPLADVHDHAPTVFFSLLEPNTRIPAHTGVTNTRLVVHLPLVIPRGCGFRVGYDTREWHPGKAWVFDDTIEHEAWNQSDEPRAVLIFDIWNPFLTAAERELVRVATQAIGDYHRSGT